MPMTSEIGLASLTLPEASTLDSSNDYYYSKEQGVRPG